MIYVVKRNGDFVDFDKQRIVKAITGAIVDVYGDILNDETLLATDIADEIYEKNDKKDDEVYLDVEDIQNQVEDALMDSEMKEVARAYIRYRYKKEMLRQTGKVYESVLELVDLNNEELKEENSNKNAVIASTQRDYMAGEVSKDVTKQFLLPADIWKAHETGEIHFHDADYFAQHIFNCCLVNLEDMLQNGTVINKTLIEKPHSFATACNIATQIIAVVASGQYGGQSISLAHLAPFVDISRKKIKAEVTEEITNSIGSVSNAADVISKITEDRLKKEIERGVQTIQYQINTLNTSNGQTPFVTVFMYLGEAEDIQTKNDLALIIEEVLRQRIQGTKNEKGAWITPAFPKLIYCLEEDNIHEDSKYWYLTKLAAECSAKRLVPDYISEKKMLELKGDVYPCMGLVA